MNNRLKIAFLSRESARDKRSYSGSLYYMGKALEQFCDVTYISRIISWENYAARLMHEVSKGILRKQLAHDRLLFVARKNAQLVAHRLADQHFDIVITPEGGPLIAFLDTTIPIFLPLDVTFHLQHDYYPFYSNLLQFSVRDAETVELASFQNATKLLFSSSWAARSAIEDYHIDPQKVHTIFFGANLDYIPPRAEVLAKRVSETCKLLFMGIGWERKGGNIAFEALLALLEMGIQAELIVCGSTPPPGISHECMAVIPYLDKNDEQQAREIEKLYAMSDFLILPTRADCAPNVYKEANAFGLPAITTATGGVADIVVDGENGYTLPVEARGNEYAQVIADIYRDQSRYTQLVQSSRTAYEERLSWDTWAKAVHTIMQEVVALQPVFR
jgi:glycosyltransferase involved in cell wall biosynthesis